MDAWQEVRENIEGRNRAALVRLLVSLDDAQRREVGEELPLYLRQRLAPGWEARWEVAQRASGFRIAGAACLGGPAKVVAWLSRRDIAEEPVFRGGLAREEIAQVLEDRPEAWRRDFTIRLVSSLRLPSRRGWDRVANWELAAAMVRATGVEPPENDAFVAGWVQRLDQTAVEDLALRDPLLDHMAARLFEAEGVAPSLEQATPVLAALSESGRVERQALLDGCVNRMLNGGDRADVEPYARLWERLDPATHEIPARDLLRLLPAAPVSVAELAAASLRRLDGERSLDDDSFAEAVSALAFRPERKLVTAALRWVAEAARLAPRRVDAGLAAVAVAFGHEALTLQERAVKLAIKLAKQAGEPGRAAITEAAGGLPGEMRTRLAEVFGELAPETAPLAPAEPVAVAAADPLPPVASPAELAQEFASFSWPYGGAVVERLLAGTVEWTHRDRDAVRDALRPWCDSTWAHMSAAADLPDYTLLDYEHELRSLLHRLALAVVRPDAAAELTAAIPARRGHWSRQSVIDAFANDRVREVITMIESGRTVPRLLATPTSGTGYVDPVTLVARLASLEAAGAEVLERDFHQALLRLPLSIDPAAVERAGALTSPRGRELAGWLAAGGVPAPEVSCVFEDNPKPWLRGIRSTVTAPEADLPEPVKKLLTLRPSGAVGRSTRFIASWPAVLPSHREVVAAHAAEILASSTDYSDPHSGVLLPLAQADGPVGLATATALAAGMGNAHLGDRTVASEALITLAARGQAPVYEIASVVVELVEADFLVLGRVASALDAAVQGGACHAVWHIASGVLAGLLPQPGAKPRAGLADLLAIAVQAAALVGPHALSAPAGLASAAARGGSSRFAQEARRLHHLLTSAAAC
ncbi:hypothetical protein SAMN05421505_1155 [Sinosporangium album]|uniref:DUF7824 domain-containing protein n=1 Tax=Sinosporangium album TaxID=504805 RepID=A0A1G8BZR1_9ACTN|nr:DUF6493 family protein [Sinosporangium album]SDH38553.1 hypothetical protein SAMN05421505_1155 [Sinosporangium album]